MLANTTWVNVIHRYRHTNTDRGCASATMRRFYGFRPCILCIAVADSQARQRNEAFRVNIKQELQNINNKLDKLRRRLAKAQLVHDQPNIVNIKWELAKLEKQKLEIGGQQARQNSSKGEAIKAMPFNRALTKKEQADMGKFKKTVRGLVVVHPMTALGKEIGVTEVTGFAPKEF